LDKVCIPVFWPERDNLRIGRAAAYYASVTLWGSRSATGRGHAFPDHIYGFATYRRFRANSSAEAAPSTAAKRLKRFLPEMGGGRITVFFWHFAA
jgi:hypothetical protein